MATTQCKLIWDNGDFTNCFRQVYLQSNIPVLLCGVSFLIVAWQFITTRIQRKSQYIALSQDERILGIPTQHYHDDVDQSGAEEEDSPISEVYVEFSKPKWQRLRISVELITVLVALAANVSLHTITHETGQLVEWSYVLFLVTLRVITLKSTKASHLQLWFHTAVIYFLQLVIGTLVLRSMILNPPQESEVRKLNIANFVLIIILNLITFSTRVGNETVELEHEDNLTSSREPLASLISKLTFSWADPIVSKGYNKTCEIDDVWNLAPSDKAARVLAAYRAQKKDRKLWLHFLNHLRTKLFIQALFGFLNSIFMFFPTLLLKAIVEYVEQPSSTPVSTAWFWVALLLVCSCLQSMGDSQALWMGRKMSVKLNAVVIGEIYAKALRRKAAAGLESVSEDDEGKDKGKGKKADDEPSLDSEASTTDQAKFDANKDSKANSGKIINLMASDSARIGDTMSYIHWLWGSTPVQLVVSIVLLYRTLGLSAFAGIVPMLVVFPVGLWISSKFFAIQKNIMAATDMRIETTNEVIINIRIIKYFAWEHRFNSKIEESRKKELTHLRNMYILWLLNSLVFSTIPFLINLAAFISYTVIEKKPLLPSVAFTSIALFQLLNMPLQMLGTLIMFLVNFKVSSDRVEKFMDEEETEKYKQLGSGNIDATGSRVVGFDNATFIWGGKDDVARDGSQAFKMIDLDLHFTLDRLNIIAGPTGSGKTSLLMALLGEMTMIDGKVYLPGGYDRASLIADSVTGLTESVAYCAQQAWLLNGTVKENILFSSPLDSKRYEDVLKACALGPDIKIWADGDATLVGEKGISLSGGQKQRISLARALYSNAKYVILDDVLSAVDSHTGRWIFDNCIQGPLMAKRTCILVTHNISLCVPKAEYVVVLDNGTVAFKGVSKDAVASGHLGDNVFSDKIPEVTNGSEPHENDSDETVPHSETEAKVDPRVETKAEGRVTWAVISLYLSSMGRWYYWAFWVVLFICEQIAEVLPNVWVREWSNKYVSADILTTTMRQFFSVDNIRPLVSLTWGISVHQNTALTVNNTLVQNSVVKPVDLRFYVTVYALIGLVYVIITFFVGLLMFYGSLCASYSLHTRLLDAVTRAQFKFFDSTPLGQIINRFSKDMKTLDQEMATMAISLISRVGAIVVIIILISLVTPQFLIPAAILSVIYFYVAKYYLAASTDLKRMDSVQKSPIYQQFGETLAGVTTIRAYGDEARFILDNHQRINTANRPYIFLWSLNRWLSIRLDFTGAFISFSAAAFIVWNAETIDAGAAGLSLTYALQFTQNVLMCVRFYGMNEQNMNSVERVKQYLEIESEAAPEIEETRPPANWPVSGSVEFVDYTTSYRADLPPVLKKVSFNIKGGQKVGIVGRTGAGKSSLALSLFRALEAQEGKILIDGIDIGMIGLNDLRNSLTMVPQDPTLFTGTLRSNLDPFSLYTDEDIFTAFRNVHLIGNPGSVSVSGTATPIPSTNQESRSASSSSTLAPPIDTTKINKNIFSNLSYPITDSGSNLSGGQKQLLCLVRALLKTPKILVMDEATASIDYATDTKIQETIRGLGCTIITIAHRLMTIVDYDLVVVMEKGEVREFGAPWELLSGGKGEGVFKGMCKESGDWEILSRKAKEAWATGGDL